MKLLETSTSLLVRNEAFRVTCRVSSPFCQENCEEVLNESEIENNF